MRKESKNNFLRILIKIYPQVIKTMPKDYCLLSLIDIFHGISFGVIVVMTQRFFDHAADVFLGNQIWQKLIISAVILILAQVSSQILNGLVQFYAEVLHEKGAGILNVKIQKKVGRIRPIEFERVQQLEAINKAQEGALQASEISDLFNSIFTFYIPYFLFMTFYLYKIQPILIVSLILIFIPSFIGQLKRVSLNEKLEDEIAIRRRQMKAYKETMIDPVFIKETRVFGAFSYIREKFIKSIKKYNMGIWNYKKKVALIETGLNICSLCAYLVIIFMLIILVVHDNISVGEFAAIFMALNAMFFLMDEICSDSIGGISEGLGAVENYLKFMDLPELGTEEIAPVKFDIELKRVSFRYPDNDYNSLTDIDIYIKEGESVAIIGENGAGKSTLGKLLTGIYIGQQGEMKIGGVTVTEKNQGSVYSYVSAVFQDFIKYKLTLKENIIISDVNKKESIKEVLQKAQILNLNSYSDTVLSKEFGGIELSGGEWQRLAIARGYYREREIMVLDEPTAAIDPIEERNLYLHFLELAKEKTAFIITHRMAAAQWVDKVIVLKNGVIDDMGAHDELMSKKGYYYELWNSQAKWYE
jgi:ABC-type multidrug transport system, ATPase and permease components